MIPLAWVRQKSYTRHTALPPFSAGGFNMMDATAQTRVRRLAEALSAVSQPLVPLYEYAEDLQKHLSDDDEVQVLCIAALLRARAHAAKQEIAQSLQVLEDAASNVAGAL